MISLAKLADDGQSATEGRRSRHVIRRQSLPAILAQSLKERILNGEFKEGDPLVQETIATEYECSRIPVREAFKQLEAEGLIVSKMHKGAVVSGLPSEQILELFELRAMLESNMLKYALPKLTDEVLDRAEAILDTLSAAYRARDIAQVGTLNWAFHSTLYEPSGRVQTLALAQGINVQTDRYIRLHIVLTSAFKEAERDHRQILELCRQRDRSAVEFMKKHILQTGRKLIAALGEKRTAE